MIDQDLLADLPAPRDDEPPSLRDDIAAELGDHLRCALRRELLKDADETTAERRVLDRFGDPRKLARRLWWQAMWSRVMGQRVLSGLQWMVTLAAAVLAGFVFWQQSTLLSEMRSARQEDTRRHEYFVQALTELRGRGAAVAVLAPGEPPGGMMSGDDAFQPLPGGVSEPFGDSPGAKTVDKELGPLPQGKSRLLVKLVEETPSGPPAKAKQVILKRTGEETAHQSRILRIPVVKPYPGIPAHEGKPFLVAEYGELFAFEIEPGRYELTIKLADQQQSTQSVSVAANESRELTVVCPKPRTKAAVYITAPPLPDDLREAGLQLGYIVEEGGRTINRTHWYPPQLTSFQLLFDERTGQLQQALPSVRLGNEEAESKVIDLTQSAAEDRAIIVWTGMTSVRFLLHKKQSGPLSDVFPLRYPVPQHRNSTQSLQRIVEPGENRWELELPEKMLTAARNQLADIKGGIPDASQKGAAEAKPEPLGDKCRLIVKLTSETKDGPVPEGASVQLLDERGKGVVIQLQGRQVIQSRSEPDTEGRCVIGPFDAGRYRLHVRFSDGRNLLEKLRFIRPGEERTEHIVCPPAVKKAVAMITAPPAPDDLLRPGVRLTVSFGLMDQDFEGRKWTNEIGTSHSMEFDVKTGLLNYANGLNQQDIAPEERLVLLPTGPYKFYVQLLHQAHKKAEATVLAEHVIRDLKPDSTVKPDFTAEPGENQWEIKVPDEFWAEARKKLAELEKPTEKPADAEAK